METRFTWRRALCAAALSALALACGAARAQAGGVTLVVGYAPGGSADLVARAIAPALSRQLGRPVQVENVAGASGAIAAVKVALAEPDGRTLLLGSPSELGINHLTGAQARLDPLRELTPIGLVGSQPMVLVASRQTGVRTVDDFLRHAQQHAGQDRYASSGAGTPLHLAGEMIRQRAGLDIRHTPYRGASLMLPDLLAGRVEFAVMVLSSALPALRDGRLQALGITEAQRSPAAPEVPALAEHSRLASVDMGVWFGLAGPARLPPQTLAELRGALRAALAEAEVKRPLQQAGITLMPEREFGPFLRAELQKFGQVIEAARLRE